MAFDPKSVAPEVTATLLGGLIGFMIWVTRLEKAKSLYEDEICELRSQLAAATGTVTREP